MNRRLDDSSRDQGAVLIWVALMMVVLLGMGALVIDIGALYVEKRQLQNGADAGALAVAQDCANGDCGSYTSRAREYADLNAKDGASAIDGVCGTDPLPGCASPPPMSGAADGASGWVMVKTSTLTSDGGTEVGFVLAPIMTAITGKTIHASAIAAWGPLGRTSTFPFTISECIFGEMGGDLDPENPMVPDGVVILYSKSGSGSSGDGEALPPEECGSVPGGGTAAGNFGWLDRGDSCLVDITSGGTVGGDTGASVIAQCDLPELGETVVIPVYRTVAGTGTGAVYTIVGFAGFTITGYDLPGLKTFSCGGPNWCIKGQFTEVVAPGDFGGGSDYGVTTVKMVG